MGILCSPLPRAATTTDAFNAIAEPRRREIVATLIDGKEHAVGEGVLVLRLPQPAVYDTNSAQRDTPHSDQSYTMDA
jgi:hypothetical protein